MKHPSDFAICISSYLTKHLAGTRNLSSNTIKSYRDTFCLLLLFMKEMNKKIDRICLVDIDADLVIRFLDWLEVNRGNSASTRNVRLAAIHAFFRYVQFQNPEMLLHCQRILAIPMKETEKRFVEYLPEQALRELLSLPDQTKKYGIRDTALLCLLYDSGARVQELIDLSLLDIRLETPATIDSKNPQSSTAVMISCGSTVACGLPKPAEFMIALTTPWIISKIAIISSMP